MPVSAIRVADLVQVTQGQRLTGRATGDHRDAAHVLGELDQQLGGLGVDVRLRRVLDDRGQSAIEVEPDHQLWGGAHELGVLRRRLRGGELHAPTQRRLSP